MKCKTFINTKRTYTHMRKCYICDKALSEGQTGQYCSDKCEAEAWDRSFDGSSENAYEISFSNLVDKLGHKCDSNTKHALHELIDEWNPLEWVCPKCHEVIISKELSKTLSKEEKIKRLCSPCTCGTYPVPTPPKKYF